MTTKKSDNSAPSSGSLDESLFDDLDLDLPEPEAPPAAAPLSIEGGFTKRATTPYPPPSSPGRPGRGSPSISTAAFITQPKPQSNKLLIVLVLFGLLGAAGTALYFTGMLDDFINPKPPKKKKPIMAKAVPKRAVEVFSDPQGADLRINGDRKGKTPTRLDLPIGKAYKFSASRVGCKPARKTLTLKAGKDLTKVSLKLDCGAQAPPSKAPPKAGGVGYIKVACTPKKANLEIGPEIRVTCGGASKLPFEAKKYIVKLSLKGYHPYEGQVEVEAGKTLPFEIKLKPAGKKRRRRRRRRRRRTPPRSRGGKGTISIKANIKATVFWRGNRLGSTPLSKGLPTGRHHLVVKSAFGSRKIVPIKVTKGKTVSRSLTFGKGTIKFFVRPWADIYINGRKLGQTPIPPFRAKEGTYRVELRMATLRYRRRVRLYADKVVKIKHTFNPPQ